jgi:hypothetical protein
LFVHSGGFTEKRGDFKSVLGLHMDLHAAGSFRHEFHYQYHHRERYPGPSRDWTGFARIRLLAVPARGIAAVWAGGRRSMSDPLIYRGLQLDAGYRADMIVDDRVIVELKAVDTLAPIHKAQMLTYLKLAGKPTGLLINFNVPILKDGVQRVFNPEMLKRAGPSDGHAGSSAE